MSAAAAPAIDIVTALRSAWKNYQPAERTGLAFGQRLHELRAGAEVVQGGTTFASSLDAAGIPRRTAYYWIHGYEISIGVREPKEEKPKHADVVQVHVTTRDKMAYRPDPSAPKSEVEVPEETLAALTTEMVASLEQAWKEANEYAAHLINVLENQKTNFQPIVAKTSSEAKEPPSRVVVLLRNQIFAAEDQIKELRTQVKNYRSLLLRADTRR